MFCKYLLKEASYRKRHLFMKYAPLNYASIGGTPETIGVTVESVEQFEVMSFLKHEIIFSVFCKYLLKDASYRKRPPFMKYAPLNYASIGGTPERIGPTGESVEQFEVISFFERKIIFSVFCKYPLNEASYRKRPLFMKYTPLNFASIGGTPETIGITGESVEQFELMSFLERRNNFLRFLQISPKGRILQKKASLYEICASKLRIDWWYSGNDWCYG